MTKLLPKDVSTESHLLHEGRKLTTCSSKQPSVCWPHKSLHGITPMVLLHHSPTHNKAINEPFSSKNAGFRTNPTSVLDPKLELLKVSSSSVILEARA